MIQNNKVVDYSLFTNIDWSLLAKAQSHYERQGYKYIETPYAVPTHSSAVTKPHNDPSFILNLGHFNHLEHELVGSAEQGFIQMLCDSSLPAGKYCSITPCFRVEPAFSPHSLPWFMKLELISTPLIPSSPTNYQDVMQDAFDFFTSHLLPGISPAQLTIVPTSPISSDILLRGIEIGSYGVRCTPWGDFVYGTGLALPRFTLANKI